MKRSILFFALVLIVVIPAVAGWFYFYSTPPTLDVTPVMRGPAIEAVYATAIVEPVKWASIAPVKSGRVIEVLGVEGLRVDSGVPLATMDYKDLQAQLDEQLVLIRLKREEKRRAEILLKNKNISKEAYDQRVSEYEQAEARLHVIEEQIEQHFIRAPTNGTVLWRDVEVGEVKAAGETIFWIGDPSPMRLEAEVDEEDIPRIKPGQTVLITADAFPDEVMTGTVASITPMGDPVNKSYRVYVSLPEDTKLMIGMTVETNTVVSHKKTALLVPSEAVIKGPAVWKIVTKDDKTTAIKTPVIAGVKGEENIEVLEGLEEQDLVLISPPKTLLDGQQVYVNLKRRTIDNSVSELIEGSGKPKSGCGSCGGNGTGRSGCAGGVELTEDRRANKEWQGPLPYCGPSR